MKLKAVAFFKDKNNLMALGLALMAAFILFPNNLIMHSWPIGPADPYASLDPSWNLALNYAKIKGLAWGSDFIFTYGPLSTLCTRLGWEINASAFLLFDLFMFLNYFLMFFIAVRESRNKILTIVLIAGIVWIVPAFIGSSNAVVLMLLLIFWIRKSMDHPHPVYYILQITILTLLFFIKFNTGLIVFVFYFAGIGYSLMARKTKTGYLIVYAIIPLVLVIALSQMLNVSLGAYIQSGIDMVTGYNEIMYLKPQIYRSKNYAGAIALLLLIVIVANLLKDSKLKGDKIEWLKKGVAFFLFAASFFILYKQAFVRGDAGHAADFFIYLPFVMFCNLDLHRHVRNIAFQLVLVAALSVPFYFLLNKKTNYTLSMENKLSKKHYFEEYANMTPTSGIHIFGQGIQLADSIKQKIGKATVDVYPWNIQMLLENQLNYLPRPVCQSYTAYTPYLEEQNFNHYNNALTAPEFVIYDFLSIDDRYPLFDESKMNLALYYNYNLVETFDYDGRKMLLLQRNSNFKPIRLEKIREYESGMNLPLVPKDGVYYEVSTHNTLLGKIAGVFENAPGIRLHIKIDGGELRRYKTSKPLLQSGIFSKGHIGSTAQAALFFSHQLLPERVKFYKFKPFKDKMFTATKTITEYKITPQ